MLNKKKLLDRLALMAALPDDWDGFGSIPISDKVYDVSNSMIKMIQVDIDLDIYVGVKIDGSLYAEAFSPNSIHDFNSKRIEITVLPDGMIDYVDRKNLKVISLGSFYLSSETINDILYISDKK